MFVEEGNVKRYGTYEFDNRDAGQMLEYMEARIEALKRRILQLEAENEALRWKQYTDRYSEYEVCYAASA
ncbi:MAG: hypothetical protein DMG14_26870 [Acidobacteria bacterium]|nr:MAG: hypothetical protein DMG14_26870 [Acidobacteriota bacterium]